MKKLMLICSVTFMFLLVGTSATAQNLSKKEQAIQNIKTYLQDLPSTTTTTISSATLGGSVEAQSTSATIPANRIERRLFEELVAAIKSESSPEDAIDLVVNRYESPGVTKNSLVAFRQKAEELLNF